MNSRAGAAPVKSRIAPVMGQILELSRTMGAAATIDEVLGLAAQAIPSIVPSVRGSIALILRDDPTMFEVFALKGDAAIPIGVRMQLDRTAVGVCVATGRCVCKRAQLDSEFADMRMLAGSGLWGSINAPLIAGGRVIGTLNVANDRPFAPEDETHLFHAALVVAANVESRQRLSETIAALAEARLVLDNMGQGFFTLDAKGRVEPGLSAALLAWFGAPVGDEPGWDWIGRQAPTFAAWLECGWEEFSGQMPPEVVVAQLPVKAVVEGRSLSFEWRAIWDDDGSLARMVVVVVDRTAVVQERIARERSAETIAAFDNLGRDRSGFLAFYDEAIRIVELVMSEAEPLTEELRGLHTLKGNAAAFGATSLSAVCARIESSVSVSADGHLTDADRGALRTAWDDFVARVGPFVDRMRTAAVELAAVEYAEFMDAVRARQPYPTLLSRVRSWRNETVHSRLARLARHAEALCERYEKQVRVDIDVWPAKLALPPEQFSELWSSLVHLIRNVVDHGLELPEERLLAGKQPAGQVALRARFSRGMLEVSVSDDGAGIDWERVSCKASALGHPAEAHADLVDALFADGMSTRDQHGELSGRGVGLAAVKGAVVALGGTLQVDSARGSGTQFRLEVPLTVH